jgi:hypothetical protein
MSYTQKNGLVQLEVAGRMRAASMGFSKPFIGSDGVVEIVEVSLLRELGATQGGLDVRHTQKLGLKAPRLVLRAPSITHARRSRG